MIRALVRAVLVFLRAIPLPIVLGLLALGGTVAAQHALAHHLGRSVALVGAGTLVMAIAACFFRRPVAAVGMALGALPAGIALASAFEAGLLWEPIFGFCVVCLAVTLPVLLNILWWPLIKLPAADRLAVLRRLRNLTYDDRMSIVWSRRYNLLARGSSDSPLFVAASTIAETARLRLRRFQKADLPAFIAYRNDPEVARYQGWEGITAPEARRFIARQRDIRLGEPGQGCQIAVALKDTDQLIGDCYFLVDEREPRQAEIGYSLARAQQGQGYAAEAVAALLTWLFQSFGLHRVVAVSDCRNDRSIALLERLGLRREGHFLQNVWFKGAWADEYSYAVLRDEWLARTDTRPAGTEPEA